MTGLVVGLDVGGTYTDLVARAGEQTIVLKVPSTPRAPHEGILTALERLRERGHSVESIVHGVTIATNAVITRRGGPVALVTTEGFRDVLEMRRRDRPDTYGLHGNFSPLVPRHYRFGTPERTRADGTIERPADLTAVIAELRHLDPQPAALAVSFLHSFRNPANELAARDQLHAAGYELVSLSHEINPEIGEFERTSTTVLNAFLQPVIADYVTRLTQGCDAAGDVRDVLILHGNGGAMTLDLASRFPVRTVMSGPAGGVLAAAHLALQSGFDRILTCDIGGTSTDAAVVIDGAPARADAVSVEFGVPLRTAMTEVVTIGAGGGSLAAVDRGGLLTIGPQSAGADPGPVCYGLGQTIPTLTDAHLVLGRINAGRPIGTVAELNLGAAREAIDRVVARPLGLSVEEAAHAMLETANQKMAGALRLISVERGHDPSGFALVAFGGGGPLHACALTRASGAGAALIPAHPGATSAWGCLLADFRGERSVSVRVELADLDDATLARRYAEELDRLRDELRESGVRLDGEEIVEYGCTAALVGQQHTLDVPLGTAVPVVEVLAEAFRTCYTQRLSALPEHPAVIVHELRVGIRVPRPTALPDGASSHVVAASSRSAWFEGAWTDTPVYARSELVAGKRMPGPLIVEQEDTTIVVEPGFTAVLDEHGLLVVRPASSTEEIA